jgi:hypothetical protein
VLVIDKPECHARGPNLSISRGLSMMLRVGGAAECEPKESILAHESQSVWVSGRPSFHGTELVNLKRAVEMAARELTEHKEGKLGRGRL